jgi:hypothetical protein
MLFSFLNHRSGCILLTNPAVEDNEGWVEDDRVGDYA